MLQRSRVFSTVLYLVRTKNIKEVRLTFLQCVKKAQTSMYTSISIALAPGKGVLPLKKDQDWNPRRKGISFFIFSMDILYFWSGCPLPQ